MRITIILLFLLISTFPIKLSAQYKIMFSNSYPPYNYTNENGDLIGFNVDIINAIKDIYGLDISIHGDEWNVINKALENSDIQAIGGAHYPGVPDEDYIYTRSTINTFHCFLYNTNFLSNFSIEHLRTSKEPLVAMWKNDILIHYVLSINPTAKFLYADNYLQLINMLDRKDVTCIFGQRVGSMYYAKKLGKNYLEPLDHRILERNMGFKVSKGSPELAEFLNNGLEIILANGVYQQIYDKWITEYDKAKFDWKTHLKLILIASALIATLIFLLLIANRILKTKVRNKTKDLQQQLEVNSQIMIELEKQKIKAEESDKMKSAFLANMSHEIRTPMNGILGFADLLKSVDYSSKEQEKFIDIIQQSGNRMLVTINNIIDLSKLESGMEKIQIKEVNIRNIMSELFSFFSPEASVKGLKLTLKENDSISSEIFYTDEYKLNSILTNLIKNALKFTAKGSIEIEYAICESMAEFWVTDTGIGIAKNKQDSIFDQFVQADFSYSSGFEGSGLGLSISKGYVTLLDGEIKLESEEKKGSQFYVRIPNNISPEGNSLADGQIQDSKQTMASKYNILIAEDDASSFSYLQYILKNVSKHIIHAKDGLEVIELTKNNSEIDIILMDIKMPKLNGFEATKEIRGFNKNVFIIAQTAYAQESDKAKAIESGCNAYIAKPINKEKLLEIIYLCQN